MEATGSTARQAAKSGALLSADPLAERGATPPLVSFEFFPPKTDEMEEKLWQTIKRLEWLAPRFVSVTYGAGGSTRERTHATVTRIRRETRLQPAAPLTFVGASRARVEGVPARYGAAGTRHSGPLRGDPPGGEV